MNTLALTRRQETLPASYPTTMLDDRPIEQRAGWIILALFFGLFLGFAIFVRLDAATYAEGTIAVSGSRQAVQHRDGGIVSGLFVREGQHVQAGQILIQLSGMEVAANEEAAATDVIHLLAQRARLEAERSGMPSIAIPSQFALFTGKERFEADQALSAANAEMHSRRAAIVAQKDVLHQQSAQLRQRIAGLKDQIAANDTQNTLFGDELAGMQDLAREGFASTNRVRALERSRAQISGDTANLSASSAAAREQIGEQQMQSLTLDAQHQQEVSQQLNDTIDKLGAALPKWQTLKLQLENTRIRAPVSGQVVGLNVFTVGGVVAAGVKLMEIVPDAAPLVVEMDIMPNDADDLHVGQEAEVRFPALHDRTLPVFKGHVSRVSADSLVDQQTGRRYFTGQVVIDAKEIDRITKQRGHDQALKAGLPAQVLVPQRKRSLFEYLVEPLNMALWRSGREA